jgi:hypothetical protein
LYGKFENRLKGFSRNIYEIPSIIIASCELNSVQGKKNKVQVVSIGVEIFCLRNGLME